ncbi:hypothetical protein GCM10009118_06840 [Wandonia haliotis]|uniref:Lipoprotein n=1 Tax=Wandonia haliotis TaxID=574963 RepID=A0ABN1MLW9_9FLAO
MKKVIFTLLGGLMLTASVTSCNKCAECTGTTNNIYEGEYCKGNAVKNAMYETAKTNCEAAGGTFK